MSGETLANVETAVEVVEHVAEVTEKLAANAANSLPENGSLHKVAVEIEYIAEVVDKDAHNLKGESNVKPQVKDGSIPFVIDAPNDLKDLSSLLDGRSEAEIIEIISRIRTCNSIRLAAENRRKMQVSKN